MEKKRKEMGENRRREIISGRGFRPKKEKMITTSSSTTWRERTNERTILERERKKKEGKIGTRSEEEAEAEDVINYGRRRRRRVCACACNRWLLKMFLFQVVETGPVIYDSGAEREKEKKKKFFFFVVVDLSPGRYNSLPTPTHPPTRWPYFLNLNKKNVNFSIIFPFLLQ